MDSRRTADGPGRLDVRALATRCAPRTVRSNLLAGFGLLLALLLVVVFVGVRSLGTLSASHENVVSRVLPAIEAADATRSWVGDMHFAQTRYVMALNTHPDFAEDYAEFERNLALLAKRTAPEDEKLLQRVQRVAARWKATDDRLWGSVSKGDWSKAGTIVHGDSDEVTDELVTALDDYRTTLTARAERMTKSFRATHHSTWLLMTVLGGVAILLAVALALLIGRSIGHAARKLRDAAAGIAEGDVEQTLEIRRRDELGETAAAFDRMIAYLRDVAGATTHIANGDLNVDIQPRSERDLVGNALVGMLATLRQIVGGLTTAADGVTSASQQMVLTSVETGRAVGEIAHAISDVASGAERQVQQVEQARISATETSAVVGEARSIAEEGVDAAAEASVAMSSVRESSLAASSAINALESKSEQIAGIVQTITAIASQTNLLALNAAIEAARAGEQGRGFAVVAEEVRKLAEESQAAAGSIGTLIEEIGSETRRAVEIVEDGARRTEDGVAVVTRTREAFEQIVAAVIAVTEQIDGIVRVTDEVAAVAEESSASTQQVSASTQQTSASSDQITSSAHELARTAEDLRGLVERFRLAA